MCATFAPLLAERVTLPAPAPVPTNVGEALVASSTRLLLVRLPVTAIAPFFTVVGPVYWLFPERVSVPAPAFVRPNVPPKIDPMVRFDPFTLMVRLPVKVTDWLPRSMSALPRYV